MSPTTPTTAFADWLRPLRLVLDPAGRTDWARLAALARALEETLTLFPIGTDPADETGQRGRLAAVRHELARRGHLDTRNRQEHFPLLAQFLCGYQDIDLRDAVGLGHGALIARRGSPRARRDWIPRLLAGELAGIAVTESHGGSRPAGARTRAVTGPGGTWLVTGQKSWISRLTEAAVFVVFFRAPDGCMAAAAVDAAEPGLYRHAIRPSGLAGWTWGTLDLDAVRVRPDDVLLGDGMAVLREHFAGYRPLVTATALGGAAAVFDAVAAELAARVTSGDLSRLRDSALISLGRSHAQLVASLLGAAATCSIADAGNDVAEPWSAEAKAFGVDVANSVTAELALLVGAAGFRADSRIAKNRHDLTALLYADGIHDSLYLTAGRHHAGAADRSSVN